MKNKLSTLLNPYLLAGATVALFSIGGQSPAAAASVNYSFGNIAGGDTFGDALNGNFQLQVTDDANNDNVADNFVTFFFKNNAPSGDTSAIKGVFFDYSSSGLLGTGTTDYLNTGTVDFKNLSSGGNLPQGNNLATNFNTDFSTTTDGGNSNAVQRTERLGIKFNYGSLPNFQAVIDALNKGVINAPSIPSPYIRVGIHVGSLANGKSDSYVSVLPTTPPPQPPKSVPEPSSLLGLVLIGGAFKALRRNKSN